MKTLSSICCLLGAAALTTISCNAADQNEATASVIELTVAVNGKASFALPSNAATGYSWDLAQPLPEGSPVSITFDTTGGDVKEDGEPLCGAPGETLITVSGVHEGTETVTIVYARPWEKDTPPVQSRTIHVTVTK